MIPFLKTSTGGNFDKLGFPEGPVVVKCIQTARLLSQNVERPLRAKWDVACTAHSLSMRMTSLIPDVIWSEQGH